jgi:transcriptional regulator with XRE-family HTH domain
MQPEDIKELRRELGWSLAQFGRYFGVTAQAVLRWERGTARPNNVVMATMIQLRNRLNGLREKQQIEQFKQGLRAALLTGGLVALLHFLFNENE